MAPLLLPLLFANGAITLRSLLFGDQSQSPSPGNPSLVVAGVHDALSAKVFASAGAKVLFLSGFGVSATRLGQPDAGLLTLNEMEETARHVVAAAAVGSKSAPPPVIVDGDTGYGGAANIRRTVRGLAAAGAAAVTIEDQVFPKRCTIAAGVGVRVVSRDQSAERIRCSLAARDEARDVDGNDVLIVARTDCRAALGLDEAVERCKIYEALGADVVYAENLKDRGEYEILRRELRRETPMMLAQVQQGAQECEGGGSIKVLNASESGEMGYCLALFGVSGLQAYVSSLERVATALIAGGGMLHDISTFSNLKEVVGFPMLDAFESKFNIE